MGWSATWKDILNGGNPRWKVTDLSAKKIALGHIMHASKEDGVASSPSLNILCPLAGDDEFVHHAWTKGHRVVAIDLVPAAVEAMRNQFSVANDGDGSDDGGNCWLKEERSGGTVVWRHGSGTVTLYESDMLAPLPELEGTFDAVYDKDSFGALDLHMRPKYCERIAAYVKPGAGILYAEVKYKDVDGPGRKSGPPYHVEKEDLMEQGNFGAAFEYVAGLGELYKLTIPGVRQTGHILRRCARK